jgi:hypothetical protein
LKVIAIAMLLSGASELRAQETDLQPCLEIADIRDLVACYDKLAREQQSRKETSVAVPAETRPQQPSASISATSDKRQEFGLSAAEREERRAPQADQADELITTIASAKSVGANYWQFTTAEGLIWRLVETRRSFRVPRAGSEVKIRRGRLGSFYLEAGGQPSIRVVRIN